MMRRFASLALAVVVPAFLLAAPAFGQGHGGGGGGSHGGGGGGGGGHSGGGSSSGGSHASGGGTRSGGGGAARSGATGGSGTAVSRSRASSGAGSTTGSGATATARRGDSRTPRTADGVATGTPPYSRPRDGRTPVGTAVPRGTVPVTGLTGAFIPAGYYGGFFPFGYGLFGVPFGVYGGNYSAYYGGYYDPWYGGYPAYSQSPSSTSTGEEGSLRLKVKPKEAEVYVDGYYVGIVDDFNGTFQKLHLDSGAHRMEIRAPGYEPLTFDLRISAGHKTTYEGELKKIP